MGNADKDRETLAIGVLQGNALFEKAVTAIGLDVGKTLMQSVVKTLGIVPAVLNADDLGHLLPEIDRRLRQLVPEEQADAAVKRLYRLLFEEADAK